MPLRSQLARAVSLALVLVAGCGAPVSPPGNPDAPTPPIRVPGPELGGVKQDLKNIQEDVTPPNVIGPGTPTPELRPDSGSTP